MVELSLVAATPDQTKKHIPFSDFLESVPPCSLEAIADLCEVNNPGGRGYSYQVNVPPITLHCEKCEGPRTFRHEGSNTRSLYFDKPTYAFVSYLCSNCRSQRKMYALSLTLEAHGAEAGTAYKLGELPTFGPATPSRLMSLLGTDGELFFKGRRCESQGLGVGAYAYYRRVVVNQKNRILDEVIKVARTVSAPEETVKALEKAKLEGRFKESMETAKDAMPAPLLINGHNPLTLLHNAISDGLHDRDEAHCLELAQDIREVLAEFAERMAQALKDTQSLKSAVNRLMKAPAKAASAAPIPVAEK